MMRTDIMNVLKTDNIIQVLTVPDTLSELGVLNKTQSVCTPNKLPFNYLQTKAFKKQVNNFKLI